jgi:hypothetical protein
MTARVWCGILAHGRPYSSFSWRPISPRRPLSIVAAPMALTTLADARELVEKNLPAQHRAKHMYGSATQF